MKGLIEKLCANLNEQINILKDVYAIEEQKQDVLTRRDLKELETVSQNERQLIIRTDKNELQRMVLTRQIAGKAGLSYDNATILNIANRLSGDAHSDSKRYLLMLRDDLIRLTFKIRNINEVNNQILKDNLDFFNYSIRILSGQNFNEMTYDPDSGKKARRRTSVLIDREA